jgi:hypothetical protein
MFRPRPRAQADCSLPLDGQLALAERHEPTPFPPLAASPPFWVRETCKEGCLNRIGAHGKERLAETSLASRPGEAVLTLDLALLHHRNHRQVSAIGSMWLSPPRPTT